MTDRDPSTPDASTYRRSIDRTAPPTGDDRPSVEQLRAAPGTAGDRATPRVPDSTDRSRREFLAAVSAGAGAGALGLGSGTAAADHDEREMPEEFSDRGIPTPWLHRDGNLIKDPDGNTVKLRGVNVTDPARAQSLLWRSPLWQNIARATDPERDWYSRIIRIPCQTGDMANVSAEDGSIMGSPTDEVEPGSFSRAQLEAYVENYLRPAVDFCERMGVYAIVDYHRHSNQQIRYDSEAVHEELMLFWDVVAPEFSEDSHVLYEVYNEPIGPYVGESQSVDAGVHDDVAEDTWLQWREAAQPWVDKIREHAERNIVIIGSPRWTQWTWWAKEHEFEGENLAYAGHVYTHENMRPLERYFGEPAEEVPVFMSEFGWTDGSNADFLNGTPEEHGQEFREFMESKDSIHWQAWAFDAWWQPIMFGFDDSTHEWSLLGAPHQGEFVRDWLKETRNDLIPGSDDTTSPGAPADQWVNEAGATWIDLGWEAVDGADHYRVYLEGEVTAEPTDTTVTIEGLDSEADYEIGVSTVDADGAESDVATTTVTTDTVGDPCPDAEARETLETGQTVCDVDGDGEYRDVTGDGSVTNSDVTEFFGNQHVDPWDSRADLFDFTGDDDVSQADVIELFSTVN